MHTDGTRLCICSRFQKTSENPAESKGYSRKLVTLSGYFSVLSLTVSLTVAAALLPVQPQLFKGSIFIRHHHRDGGLRVVHVECATSGDQLNETGGAVVVADVERKRQAVLALRCL